jgi:integrative and conjugative element protein (TIGR02256 family)
MPKREKNGLESEEPNRILKISEKVRKAFEKYEQKEGCCENGGILLGHVARDYVMITEATTPTRFDLKTIITFVRAKIPAQLRINKAWRKSNGALIYLGEWHTHRETNPTPSAQDKKMILKSLQETKMEIDFLYLIVVGINRTYWVGKQNKNGLTKVENFEIN